MPKKLKLTKEIYDCKYMKKYIQENATKYNLKETLKSLDFAISAHANQKRRNSNIPYIYHPLSVACHAFAMNLIDDSILSACLLHDVVEDCNVDIDELPVNKNIKDIVLLLTHNKNERDAEYFNKISTNKKASLIKLIDRCNNLTSMSWGMSKQNAKKYIIETEKYVLPLLNIVKKKYNNAAWLLSHQIRTMIDIYKSYI